MSYALPASVGNDKKWLNLKYVSIDKEMDDIICRSNGTDKQTDDLIVKILKL